MITFNMLILMFLAIICIISLIIMTYKQYKIYCALEDYLKSRLSDQEYKIYKKYRRCNFLTIIKFKGNIE